jgi:hypothetical protein
MADPTLKYQPKATWEKGKEIYVDWCSLWLIVRYLCYVSLII